MACSPEAGAAGLAVVLAFAPEAGAAGLELERPPAVDLACLAGGLELERAPAVDLARLAAGLVALVACSPEAGAAGLAALVACSPEAGAAGLAVVLAFAPEAGAAALPAFCIGALLSRLWRSANSLRRVSTAEVKNGAFSFELAQTSPSSGSSSSFMRKDSLSTSFTDHGVNLAGIGHWWVLDVRPNHWRLRFDSSTGPKSRPTPKKNWPSATSKRTT